jgi:hypothetical protein
MTRTLTSHRHFNATCILLPTLGRPWTHDFLAIDLLYYTSHMSPCPEIPRPPFPYGPCLGDQGGFVHHLIDTDQDVLDAEAPGYAGELKILSSLVFEDVYPLLATKMLRPSALWLHARLHPRGVYVGHTTACQECWWEFNRLDFVARNETVFWAVRRRKAELEEGK